MLPLKVGLDDYVLTVHSLYMALDHVWLAVENPVAPFPTAVVCVPKAIYKRHTKKSKNRIKMKPVRKKENNNEWVN